MDIRYHLDENLHHAIAHGLRRRGIDVTTTNDAGLMGCSDEQQLAHAHQEGRVLVTHDDDLIRIHYQNIPHSGIAFAHARRHSIGHIVNALTALHRRHSAEAMARHIEYL